MNRLLAITAFCICLMLCQCSSDKRPARLSESLETIELAWVNWACDCPDWIETRLARDSAEIDPEQCIYLEAGGPGLQVPNEFYTAGHFSQALRLTGRFYQTPGIPAGYEPKTTGKIEPGRVFRYEKIDIINR